MTEKIMVYGATGYTGRLVVAEARARGVEIVLAGRNAEKLEALADGTGESVCAVALDDRAGLNRALQEIRVVLHIAGPFSQTAAPMVEACLATGTHYLDVTGEIDIFEALARRDAAAREAGIMLLPGVGFDVVPSDCLAAHAAARVDDPRRIRMALAGIGGGVSRGTAKTALESFSSGLRVRRDGVLQTLPSGSLEHHFDFGAGPTRGLAMPLGDVSTAFHSTSVPNIEMYLIVSGQIPALMRASRFAAPLLRIPALRQFIEGRIDRMPEGPSEAERVATRSFLLAEVEDASGERVQSILETPSPYALTPVAALEAALRCARGQAEVGFQTPATAFGADFVLELADCKRSDLEADPTRTRTA